jgi:hypothetical protein
MTDEKVLTVHYPVLNSDILNSGHVMWEEDVWYCEPCEQEVVGEPNIYEDQELCGGCYEDILYVKGIAVYCDIHEAWIVSDAFDANTGGYVCEDCYEHLTARWTTKDAELFQQRGHDV